MPEMRLLYVDDDLAARFLADHEHGVIEVHTLREARDLADHLTNPADPVAEPELMEQVRRNAVARNDFLERFETLDAEGLARFAGSRSSNLRATASRWLKEGSCFSVESGGRRLFPVFQLDPDRQRPYEVVADVLRLLREARLDGWALPLWWATPHDILEWRVPADVLAAHPEAVLAAAALDRETLG
jgi:hypothetical protein